MKRMLKYTIDDLIHGPTLAFRTMMQGAVIRSVQAQRDAISIWAECDESAPLDVSHRVFQVVGTGYAEIADNTTYLGTVQLAGGSLVLHVYEVHP